MYCVEGNLLNKLQQIIMFLISFSIIFPTVGTFWVFVHELGHAIGALLVGLKISSFKFGPFAFYLQDGKYKFKVYFKTLDNYLGRVHPIVYNVQTDKQYNSLTYKVVIILLGGPIIEIISFCLFFFIKDFIPNEIIRVSILMTITTFFVISFLFGQDIPGVIKIFTEKVMQEINIYAWSMYGNWIDVSSNKFIIRKLLIKANQIEYSLTNLKKAGYQGFYYILLELYLAGYAHVLPKDFISSLEGLTTKICRLSTKKINEQYFILVYRYLCYLVVKGEDKKIIQEKYFQLEKFNELIKRQDVIYEKKRAEHFLGLKDNSEFLSCKDNLFNFFYHDEGFFNINKRILQKQMMS